MMSAPRIQSMRNRSVVYGEYPIKDRNEQNKYLFIRILESCNADCFFCEFARSKDPYRFSLLDFCHLLPHVKDEGYGIIRFTGGEPLLHKELPDFLEEARIYGLDTSIITNGMLLKKRSQELIESGLSQVVVSLDSPYASAHDAYRGTPGLFELAVEGIKLLREHMLIRVNTVVGPHNYKDMPAMQEFLEDIGVNQWELSPIKLSAKVGYENPQDVVATCDKIYEDPEHRLVPLGEKFYGSTRKSRDLYFAQGLVPLPDGVLCHVIGDVAYLDPKHGMIYACSLLPHRGIQQFASGEAREKRQGGFILTSKTFKQHQEHFRVNGTRFCSGCSSTAVGYSNMKMQGHQPPRWSY